MNIFTAATKLFEGTFTVREVKHRAALEHLTNEFPRYTVEELGHYIEVYQRGDAMRDKQFRAITGRYDELMSEGVSPQELAKYRQMLFNVHNKTTYDSAIMPQVDMLLHRMADGAAKRFHSRYKQLSNEFCQLPMAKQREIVAKLSRTFQSNPNA